MKEKMNQLQKQLQYYATQYYTHNQSLISDFEYDQLLQELVDLEKQYPEYKQENSITSKVGGSRDARFQKVTHPQKMLSLSNVYSYEELESWVLKIEKEVGKQQYVVELKIDGLAMSLDYQNHQLVQAVTRGDGVVGEDVTHNIYTIRSIPKKIDDLSLHVRGEVYMPKSILQQLNEEIIKENQQIRKQNEKNLQLQKPLKKEKSLLANTRNAASGSMRQLDSEITKKRKLDGFWYHIVSSQIDFKTHSESLQYLKKLGFKTCEYTRVCKTKKEIIDFIEEINMYKDEFDYDIDGMVIKVDNLDTQKKLGATIKYPKWMVAYKFPAQQVTTKIEDILITVGRTGKITPTAKLTSVAIGGSIVSNAQLHNFDLITLKDLRIGDYVSLRKAGEIIPEVVGLVKRGENTTPYKPPKFCPVCGSELLKVDQEVDYYCLNSDCDARIEESLIHFASKKAMNIEGLGESLIKFFYEKKWIQKIEDIYTLHNYKEKILAEKGFQEKLVNNLLESIEKSKERGLDKLLFGLGIRNVGEKGALQLARHFQSIDNLMQADLDTLIQMPDMGEVKASSIYNFFKLESTQKMISFFKMEKIDLTYHVVIQESFFSNKKIVITGSFEQYKRSELQTLLQNRNAKVSSSVSKVTDLVIYGQEAGSKLDKARQLNVATMSEQEFMEVLANEEA